MAPGKARRSGRRRQGRHARPGRQHAGTLHEVLDAANYLDIAPLQELACARIASLIRGKECDELRHIFGLDYDNS